jgi:hypothetical protein
VEPQPAYIPDDDFYREPSELTEMGPDEQGTLVELDGQPADQVQRIMRFSAGGVDDD